MYARRPREFACDFARVRVRARGGASCRFRSCAKKKNQTNSRQRVIRRNPRTGLNGKQKCPVYFSLAWRRAVAGRRAKPIPGRLTQWKRRPHNVNTCRIIFRLLLLLLLFGTIRHYNTVIERVRVYYYFCFRFSSVVVTIYYRTRRRVLPPPSSSPLFDRT